MKPFVVESLESRTFFTGVSILATGRLGGLNGWVQTMANEITARAGGASQVPQFVLSVNQAPNSGNLVAAISQVAGTGTPQNSSSGQIIILIDYYNISANANYGSTNIGATIANFLMNTPVDGINLTSLPIHTFGVSRGTGILDGMALALGQAGIWVDQETYLDPNPIAAQQDPPPTIYDNVAFVDNYWRNDGSTSQINDGHPVNGAYNLNVYWLDSESAGYSTPHLAPAGYYIGTIDQNATQSGEGPIYSQWYGTTPTMPARNATGWIYSAEVGAPRPLSGVWAASGGTGARTVAGQSGSQWGDVSDLTITSGNTVAAGNSINVSYIHQDRDSADTVTFYLDTDRNPYNNAFAATLGSANLAQTNSITSSTATLSTAGVSAGTYWLVAKVTDSAGHTRYAYEPVTAPLKVSSTPNPVALLSPPAIVSSAGSQAETLVVIYTGTAPIDTTSLGNANLQISGPGLSEAATYVGVDGNTGSKTRVATYSVPAPAVGWTTASDGAYTISLQPTEVRDTGNLYAAAGTIGSFSVAIYNGSLLVSQAAAASSYSLTTLGTTDWVHWGTGNNASAFDHKATGGTQISNVTKLGSGASYGSYFDASRKVSWTDGTPDGSNNGDDNYIWANNAIGAGYSFTVPASTSTQTLYVYAGGYSSGGTLTAHLSDGSAPDYIVTASGGGLYTNLYTITFKAFNPGATLTISYAKSANINGASGSVDLIAAAFVGVPAVDGTPPAAALTTAPTLTAPGSTSYNFTVTYTDNVSINQSSLASSSLSLTGPASMTAAFASDTIANSATATVTYSVAPPAGGWTIANNGTYSIILPASTISDTSGNFAPTATLGSFQIAIPAPAAPAITTDLQSQSLNAGQDASFTAAASGFPRPTVQWMIEPAGGSTFTPIAGQTSTTLDLGAATLAETGNQYEAVFSNSSGPDATTSAATLSVSPSLASLAGSQATAASSYNLTALGTSDWAHWGRANVAANFDHKSTGASQISNVTKLGSAAQYGSHFDTSRKVTWTDGAPTASSTGDDGYIWANTALGAGYSFTVPASTTPQTLYVYAGGYSSGGTLTAHLSGAAVADYVATASGNALYTNLYTITFAAASAGQTLTISYVKSSNINGTGGSVDLIAAALAGPPAPDTVRPTAAVTGAPTLTSAGSAPYNFTITYTDDVAVNAATLGNNNLLVTGTGYSQTATLVSSGLTNGPTIVATYSVPAPAGGWSTAANGFYAIGLQDSQVADTSGNFALAVANLGSFSVNIPIPGAGSLSGSLAAPASSYNLTTLGTSDWAHWGTGNIATAFDHKASGASQISNVTKLGTGAGYGSYFDSSRTVVWSDGTPHGSNGGDHSYLWANNAIGAGYSFTVPAGTTTRTLYVYAGGNSSGSTLTAQLSDTSAAPVTLTASGAGLYTNLYTITFKAASAGQTLTISLTKSSNINGTGGSVDLIAAALV
jgi:hypothetical protein